MATNTKIIIKSKKTELGFHNKNLTMTEVVTFPQDALNCHNLTVLQRLDPAIKSIVTKCSHAVIYYYLDDQWRTSDVKGSLFVVQR